MKISKPADFNPLETCVDDIFFSTILVIYYHPISNKKPIGNHIRKPLYCSQQEILNPAGIEPLA